MTRSVAKAFRAVLEPTGDRLRWTIARVPFDIAKVWPVRQGRRVKGEINGFAFRTTLIPTPVEHGYSVLVTRKMLAGASARQGDHVQILLEPDFDEPETLLPGELVRAMKAAPGLRKWFEKLAPGFRRYVGNFVAEPKSPATRQKRADDTVEWLFLVMEGEKEPPPIVRAAFQRQPLTKIGWKALTPTQRRNHLLGIFNCRTAEVRDKRTQQAIAEALKAARRIRPGTPVRNDIRDL